MRPFWIQSGIGKEELEAAPEGWLASVVEAFRERARTLVEMAQTSRYFFRDPPQYDEKAQKALAPNIRPHLSELAAQLASLSDCSAHSLEELYRQFAEQKGLKLSQVAQATRAALTGSTASPPLFQVMEIMGREKVLRRIERALSQIPS